MSILSSLPVKSVFAVAFSVGLLMPVSAAVLNVPTGQYPNLDHAISQAQDGDEIRVANDYNETNGWLTLANKSITISSYTPDFSAPSAGAQWNTPVFGGVDDALLTISNGSLTISGFYFETINGNVFFLQSNSNLTLNECEAFNVTTANTAVIKANSGVSNINITLNGSRFNENGRAVWLNQVTGTTSLNVSNSEFSLNSSWPIEWRFAAGDHTFNMEDSRFLITNNRQVRMLGFNTPSNALARANVNIERCYFDTTDTGRSPLRAGGIPLTADPNSEFNLRVSNCVFDLIEAFDHVETVAFDSQDDDTSANIPERKFQADFDHCTIVFNGENKCGFRLLEQNSVINVTNSIVDGNGEGRAALRAWRGIINSEANLLNSTLATQVATGQANLAGNEILDQSAEFVDQDNGDFRLLVTSPAINAGIDIGVTEDIEGNPRPMPAGSNPDLGAYENAEVASVAGWMLY